MGKIETFYIVYQDGKLWQTASEPTNVNGRWKMKNPKEIYLSKFSPMQEGDCYRWEIEIATAGRLKTKK